MGEKIEVDRRQYDEILDYLRHLRTHFAVVERAGWTVQRDPGRTMGGALEALIEDLTERAER